MMDVEISGYLSTREYEELIPYTELKGILLNLDLSC